MSFVVLFAACLAIVWIARRSYREAFLAGYLPVLLCLPSWPRWPIPGLPDPTFQQAALLPIAAVFLWSDRKRYRFSLLDVLVLGFVLVVGLSELINSGYAEAQNLMFDVLASALLPYVLAKAILDNWVFRVRFLRCFVCCVCFVLLTTLYELKFSYNPYLVLFGRFFPGQGDAWVTTFRYGLPRVAGPYGHAILAGIIFMIALGLQGWLRRTNLWEMGSARFQKKLFSKGNLLSGSLLTGLLLTWVRGPEIGALLAWVVSLIGRGKNPSRRMLIALAGLAVLAIPTALWFYSYVSVGRAAAVTASQESAAYRKELIERYFDVAVHHAWLGWGRNGWPKQASMPSIDNYYLLLALMHGVLALAFFLAIVITICFRLYRHGLRTAQTDRLSSTFSFDLLGIYVGFAFSLATVYLGENVAPVFFTLLGFTEAYLLGAKAKPGLPVARLTTQSASRPLRFRRVVA